MNRKTLCVLLVAVFTTLLTSFFSGANAQAILPLQRVREVNGQAPRLLAEFQQANSQAEQAEVRERAVPAFQKRFAALQELVKQAPATALEQALPAELLKDLRAAFPDSAAALEEHGEWQGSMEVLIEDDEALTGKTYHWLVGEQQRLELHFAGPEPDLKSGDAVKVTGIKLGEVAAISTTTPSLELATAALTCGPIGPQKVVVILVNFQTLTLPSGMTQEFVKGVLSGNAYSSSQSTPDWSVRDFWEQNSDGKTTLDAAGSTVVGPFTLASDYNNDTNGDGIYECQSSQMLTNAIAAADPSVNFAQYTRVLVVFPKNTKTNTDGTAGGCTWAGLASVGCGTVTSADGSNPSSYGWLRADQMTTRKNGVMLLTHEGGHNLGMSHSRSRDFGAEALGALNTQGTLSEYGDNFSTMGYWNLGFYTAKHAADQLGWLTSGTNYSVIEQAGTYTIQNYEARPAGLKALKVRRGTGNNTWLWVEGRTSTGIYDSYLGAGAFNGALIHYQDSYTSNRTDLLDFTTATSSFSDPLLAVGQLWTDPYSNVSLRVVSATSTALTVEVSYGAVPCTQANPTVTLSPAALSVAQGGSGTFNVTVLNNDTGGCTARTFNLTATVPSGWSYVFATPALTLNPGQSAQTTLTVTVPGAQPAGTYPVSARATNGSNTGTGNANVTVTQPTYALSISLSGKGSVTTNPPGTVCTAACTLQYSQAANQLVTLTAQGSNGMTFQGWTGTCSGTAATCTVMMDASKSVAAKFGKRK
jgi:M6 family metalloprotease-like protein